MIKRITLTLLLFVFSFAFLQAQGVQSVLDSLSEAVGFPGAVLTINGMSVNKSFATGLADRERGVRMKTGDRMLLGSVGKTYFATATLLLVEQGELRLDDKISKYLGQYSWFSKLPNANDITIEQLMNHTSGIREYVYVQDLWKKLNENPDKVWTVEERLSYISGSAPLFEAGKGWSYGDVNYIILGAVLEEILDETLYKYVTRHILKPLKLKNTAPSDHRKLKGLVPGYTGQIPLFGGLPEKMVNNKLYAFNPQMEWTGGGFITNTKDLTQWIMTLMKEGEVLEQSSLNKMTSPVGPQGKPAKTGYGLGLQVWETSLGLGFGHTGFMPGYLTAVVYIPERDLAMAMQVNMDNTNAGFKRGVTMEAMLDVIGRELLK